MRAHLIQTGTVWEDHAQNYRLVSAMLDEQPPAPGDLVVLPEMFDTGFSFRLGITQDRDNRTLAFLQSLARLHRVTLVGSRTLERPDGRGRNCCPVIAPGGEVLCEYHKIHPFSFGREGEFFSGGERVETFSWAGEPGARVCPTICYDLRFPELYRLGMLAGAEVFTVIANWPQPRASHRRALCIARAIENQACVLCVNRAGSDPHLTYAGGTIAVNHQGEVIGELGEEPGVLSVELDIGALRAWREQFPALRDVRLIHGTTAQHR